MSTIDPARQRVLSQAYLDVLARSELDLGQLHSLAMIRAGVAHLAATGDPGQVHALLILLKHDFDLTLKEANRALDLTLSRGGPRA